LLRRYDITGVTNKRHFLFKTKATYSHFNHDKLFRLFVRKQLKHVSQYPLNLNSNQLTTKLWWLYWIFNFQKHSCSENGQRLSDSTRERFKSGGCGLVSFGRFFPLSSSSGEEPLWMQVLISEGNS